VSAEEDIGPEDHARVAAAMEEARSARVSVGMIETLEEALVDVRAGRVEALAVVLVKGRSFVSTSFEGDAETRADLVYGVAHMARRLIEEPT
jgi:hypothetical protein